MVCFCRKMLDGKDIETITGEAELVDDHTVRVKGPEGDTRLITAQHVVIATGARPVMPPIPGIEHAVTSDQVSDVPPLHFLSHIQSARHPYRHLSSVIVPAGDGAAGAPEVHGHHRWRLHRLRDGRHL